MASAVENPVELGKKKAAYAAVDEFVRDGQVLGIGSGSTIVYAVERLAQRVKEEKLNVVCIPTSFQSIELIRTNGLKMTDLSANPVIDVAIDGADEADGDLNLIKGGGGCQLQEKIVASCAKVLVIVADSRKDSTILGSRWRQGVPIEVLPTAHVPVSRRLAAMGAKPVLRMAVKKAGPVVSDTGNFIIDADFGEIANPGSVDRAIRSIPGVVETGLFVNMAFKAFFGQPDGTVTHRLAPKAEVPVSLLGAPLVDTVLPGLKLLHRGKVRDVYEVDEHSLLFVATDRISCFDVVLSNGIPSKGKILTQLSMFWFKLIAPKVGCAHHVITDNVDEMPANVRQHADLLRGRTMQVRKLKMLPVEAIVRGFITGSGLKEYKETGKVCGIALPDGLRDCDRLPEPIFTPSTKAEIGTHDENISFEQVTANIGQAAAEKLRTNALKFYAAALEFAHSRGIILADTKFEFGFNAEGELLIGDEVLTPDSSRFWDAKTYAPGRQQDSLDKQYVRNYLEEIRFDKKTPVPLPTSVVQGTLNKYVTIYRILTGETPQL